MLLHILKIKLGVIPNLLEAGETPANTSLEFHAGVVVGDAAGNVLVFVVVLVVEQREPIRRNEHSPGLRGECPRWLVLNNLP